MKKRIAIVLGAAFLLGGLGTAAHADPIDVAGIGTVTLDPDGEVTINGNNDNGPVASGYVTVRRDSQNVCADDNGDPGESESPTCAP